MNTIAITKGQTSDSTRNYDDSALAAEPARFKVSRPWVLASGFGELALRRHRNAEGF